MIIKVTLVGEQMNKFKKNYPVHSKKYAFGNELSDREVEVPKKSRENVQYVDVYSSDFKRKKRRKKIPILRVFVFTFFLIIGLVGGMMIYAYNTLNSFNYEEIYTDTNNVSSTEEFSNVDGLFNDSKVLNVLLIGSDSMSVGDQGRSDSLLILSLNIRTKKIKITSLMRDTWIEIPGHGKDRLNAAFAYGGPKLTIETIQNNFGILIDRFACVDFEGFSKIIDALGGIDIELTAKECKYINSNSGIKPALKGPGINHLSGVQALHHSRNRDSIGSDYDRTSRQRQVLKAAVEALKNAGVGKVTEMISNLAPLVTTNFKTAEITRLATRCMTYLNYPIEEYRIPADGNVRDETYGQKMVLVINNMQKARADLKKFIYEMDEQQDNNNKIKNNY